MPQQLFQKKVKAVRDYAPVAEHEDDMPEAEQRASEPQKTSRSKTLPLTLSNNFKQVQSLFKSMINANDSKHEAVK